MPIHLQKYLAECGYGSRRECEALVAAGRVTVNGEVVRPGTQVEPGVDDVCLDGERVAEAERLYILLNKPRGVISSAKDEEGRETVVDLVHGVDARLFPAFRLDRDVEGAILLTNDGEIMHRLTDPEFTFDHTYIASVRGEMGEDKVERLREGLLMQGDVTVRANAIILKTGLRSTLIRVVFREGRKRSLRRLMAAAGHPVLELRSIAVGPVHLGDLEVAQWRKLEELEVRRLRDALGLAVLQA